MVRFLYTFILIIFLFAAAVSAEQAGSIRGMVHDKEFDNPLAGAQVTIAETGQKVNVTDDGNFVFGQVEPGTYTIVFSKEGYVRQVKSNVVVSPGKMAELEASLSGEFTEMEEFVVQDVQLGSGTEAALLNLRMESPALMDSVSSDLMSRAGAGDAASALKLVSGATVQDGKYAVVRGLPDRYVNSQMNGVRLPTADSDKRAVQLDQFPAAAIESIQVTKTFTPDQQGDASGGAVNIVLKSIPDEPIFKVDAQTSYNTQRAGKGEFLTYDGADPGVWGKGIDKIPMNKLGQSWPGPDGVSYGDQPTDYKWSISGGGKHKIDEDIKIGGFGSFFYERNSSFYDNGVNDKYWVEKPGGRMTPQYIQGTPSQGDFKTQLFDVTQGTQGVKWGGLGSVGLETENHSLSLTYMYTEDSESKATLAEDTRGKEYFFHGYDRNDPNGEGNQQQQAAPYLRTETLTYTQRSTETLQLRGRHKLPGPEFGKENFLMFRDPELDWGVSGSSSTLDQYKSQFGSMWFAESYSPPSPWDPAKITPPTFYPYKPAANFTIGNLQRIWKNISETSQQYYVNLKYPLEQWSGDKGYLKFGLFKDKVDREYNQDSFSNLDDNAGEYQADWDKYWSRVFPSENHYMRAADIDVDYKGKQDISAYYYMADVPLCSWFNIIGGARYETTELSIITSPEKDVSWYPPGSTGPVDLKPGAADVSFKQDDVLPSIGFVFKPVEKVKLHGTYSETIARQTFKELTPIQQSEYLGGDVFIGNPYLQMSALKNYDLRADYTPYEGGLVSVSYFYKDVKNPIEYEQRIADFAYTTAVNYPKGKLSGYELEFRQKLEKFWESLEGLSLGANATIINSEVTLPADEVAVLDNLKVPMKTRDMTNAPAYLYNIFMTHEIEKTGTQLSVFYTVRGDTLIAGAGQSNGKFVPSVYEKEYGTLNASVMQKMGKNCKLKFQVKNLLDPLIETVYRSDYIGDDVTKTSYRKGIEFSISLTAQF